MQDTKQVEKFTALTPEVETSMRHLDDAIRHYAEDINERMRPVSEAALAWRGDVERRCVEVVAPIIGAMRNMNH